ncbi:hypothetical protein EDD16DRAFT_350342 [Pisolithus croceorrhizus]|nr:hypothetical protein EDD16DRAFT_350342 [Pisolithus croceorrhizus]
MRVLKLPCQRTTPLANLDSYQAITVHGRWSYQRIADMHSNFFYKENVIWTLAMFWFLPFCYFDATYLYDYSFILLYNLVFTALPVIVLGAFDQDINAKAALAFPRIIRPRHSGFRVYAA